MRPLACHGGRPGGGAASLGQIQGPKARGRGDGPRCNRRAAMFTGPIVVDGKGHLMGRLASTLAKQALNGQEVVVVRCEEVTISGRRSRNRQNFQAYLLKRTNTNPKHGPNHFRAPSRIVQKAVRGMLPRKTKRGEAAMARVKFYEGVPPAYGKVKRLLIPDALAVTHLRPSAKRTRLGNLAAEMGWKYSALIRKIEAERMVDSKAFYDKKKDAAKLRKQAEENADLSKITPVLRAAGF
jgi:large subunit ribosomal protein L13Ae